MERRLEKIDLPKEAIQQSIGSSDHARSTSVDMIRRLKSDSMTKRGASADRHLENLLVTW